jgi:hypothetical protein
MSGWQDAWSEQVAMWRWVRSDMGQRQLFYWAQAESEDQPTKRIVYRSLLPHLDPILRSADPFFISEEMTDLIDAARDGFKPEPFHANDVLTDTGFAYYEKPLMLHDRNRKEVSLGAFTWAPLLSTGDASTGEQLSGVLLAFFSTADADFDWFQDDHREFMREFGAPKLSLLHIAPVWWDLDFGMEEIDADTGTYTGADSWWKAIQVTLRLMQQTIAVREEYVLPRGERRRMQREKLDLRPVVVVKLRRPREHKQAEGETHVEWTHRWITSGHWRNQPFPSLGITRQIWISAYVKGPSDKPLIVKRRAFELVR